MDQHRESADAVCTGIQGVGELKLYAKIKVNGKWTMVAADTVAKRLAAVEKCEHERALAAASKVHLGEEE